MSGFSEHKIHEAPDSITSASLTDYLYKKPEEIGICKAFPHWFKKAWGLSCHLFCGYAWGDLPSPNIELPEPEPSSNLDEALFERLGQKMFDEGASRINTIRDKAQKLLGLVGIFIPIYSATLVYASGKASTLSFPIRVSLSVIVACSILALLLSVFAALRTLAVTSFRTPFILMIFNPEKAEYVGVSSIHIGKEFMQYANYNQVRADHLADFLRASQMFFGLAVAVLSLAGSFLAISLIIN